MMTVGKAFLPLFCGFCLCSSLAVAGVHEANSAYDRRDWAVAHAEFEALARDGDPVAMFTLGTMHANGRGVPIDMTKAHYYWKLAAEAGHPAAMFNVGLTCANGDGTPKNLRLAAKWYREAAKAGYAAANTYYVNNYEYDDYPTKQAFLESLAKSGVAYAAWKRGGLAKTDKERWQWFSLAVTGSGPGKAYAEYAMGDILWSGGLGSVNRIEAIQRYKAAAEDPIEPYATYDKAKEIADRLRQGDGVPKDISSAIWWYELAQSKGWSANDDIPGLIAALKAGYSGKFTSSDAPRDSISGSGGSRQSQLDKLAELDEAYPLPFKRVRVPRSHPNWSGMRKRMGSLFWRARKDKAFVTFDDEYDHILYTHDKSADERHYEVKMSCLGEGYRGIYIRVTVDPKSDLRLWANREQPFVRYEVRGKGGEGKVGNVLSSGTISAYKAGDFYNTFGVFAMMPAEFNSYRASRNPGRALIGQLGLFDLTSSYRNLEAQLQGVSAEHSDVIPVQELYGSRLTKLHLTLQRGTAMSISLPGDMVSVFAHYCSGLASKDDVREAAIREDELVDRILRGSSKQQM